MEKIARQPESIGFFVLRMIFTVVVLIAGVLFWSWNWREIVIFYYLGMVLDMAIDLLLIATKPRKLTNEKKSEIIKRYLPIMIIWPLWTGVFLSIMLFFSNTDASRINFDSIIVIWSITAVVSFLSALIQNRHIKLSAMDIGASWSCSALVMLITILVTLPLAAVLPAILSNFWAIMLVVRILIEIMMFRWNRDKKNEGLISVRIVD